MVTKSMDLPTLINRFHDEDRCRQYLEDLRWPNGIACPKCGSTEDRITDIPSRGTHRCNECQYQFSVRAGTILQDSKLPLWKWFLATYLIAESKKGISSNQVKRMLGVTYKTAWFLTHRVRGAMAYAHQAPLLGIVEADETFVGGKPRHRAALDEYGRRKHGPRPGSTKAVVLGAVERGGQVRLRLAPDRTKKTIHEFLIAEVGDGVEAIFTDEWKSYSGIADENTRHETVNHSEEEWVRGDVHTNTAEGVWSLLKRSIVGSYHHLSVKHLPAYLDELEWRFNHRDDEHIFRETLRVLVTADPLTYADLTGQTRAPAAS
jgi:transposase-like protein